MHLAVHTPAYTHTPPVCTTPAHPSTCPPKVLCTWPAHVSQAQASPHMHPPNTLCIHQHPPYTHAPCKCPHLNACALRTPHMHAHPAHVHRYITHIHMSHTHHAQPPHTYLTQTPHHVSPTPTPMCTPLTHANPPCAHSLSSLLLTPSPASWLSPVSCVPACHVGTQTHVTPPQTPPDHTHTHTTT